MTDQVSRLVPTSSYGWACAYARKGYRVIPVWWVKDFPGGLGKMCSCDKGPNCNTPGKHPILFDWPKIATTEEAQLREWFVQKWPGANVGLAMGDGIVAVDIDNAYAQEELDARGLTSETPTQHTGSGGQHRLFRHTGRKLKNAVRFMEGVDIRTDGGFIVVAPSTNKKGAYVWNEDAHILDTDLAELPSWIADLAAADNPVRKPPINIAELWEGIPEGQRNGRLFSYACKMRREKRPDLEVLAVISTLAERCKPRVSQHEADDIVASSRRYADKREDDGLVVYDMDDFLNLDIPPRLILMSPWIREKDINMVYAWRGGGKTWFSVGMAVALATGTPFLNWPVVSPTGVLLVDGEMAAADLQHRIALLLRGAEVEEAKAPFRILAHDMQDAGIPSLDTSKGQELIEQRLEGVKVIIFDNISTLFRDGIENDSESWTIAQQWLLRLRRMGYTVILIHHANKSGTQRGTSKREDILDCSIALKRPRNYEENEGARFLVEFQKARGLSGKDVTSFEASLRIENQSATWLLKTLEDSHMADIRELFDAGIKTCREVGKELGVSTTKAHSLIQKFKALYPGRS